MTLMRVARHEDHTLTYDTDDVEEVHISTPNDVRDVTPPFATSVHRELGQAHLVLKVDFKDGKRPLWLKDGDERLRDAAAVDELRRAAGFLEAALDAEGVPADLAHRIVNRFIVGDPRGIVPVEPRPLTFRGGQTASERVAEILDAYEIPQPLRDAWREIKEQRDAGD